MTKQNETKRSKTFSLYVFVSFQVWCLECGVSRSINTLSPSRICLVSSFSWTHLTGYATISHNDTTMECKVITGMYFYQDNEYVIVLLFMFQSAIKGEPITKLSHFLRCLVSTRSLFARIWFVSSFHHIFNHVGACHHVHITTERI